jgi:flagellar hook assembly protein FlgD
MSQNYPNPFNPITTLKYELPERSRIKLQIFDISGRLVSTITDNEQTAGIHITQWRGTNEQGETVSSGMYFIRLEAQSRISDKHFQKSQKIILLK